MVKVKYRGISLTNERHILHSICGFHGGDTLMILQAEGQSDDLVQMMGGGPAGVVAS